MHKKINKENKIPKAFFVALVFALLFWSLIKLSKDYKTVISVPVSYINVPQDKLIQKEPLSNIEVQVKGTGFRLIRLSFTNNVIDLDARNLQKKQGSQYFFLVRNQKTFIQRIDSQLDDKKSWLNSIAQATVGRTLESFNDEDEVMLYDKFKSLIIELDSLTKLSNLNVDESQEEVIGIKIDSFINKIDPKIVRLPKNKSKEVDKIKDKLLNNLGSDKTANLAAVVNLLEDLLK